MKKTGGERPSLLARMRGGYDRVAFHCTRMEITGGTRVVIEGVTEILDYGNACIRLAVRDARVRAVVVSGENLYCLSYYPDAAVIEGKIASVCFCRNEEGRE